MALPTRVPSDGVVCPESDGEKQMAIPASSSGESPPPSEHDSRMEAGKKAPWTWKLAAVLLISAVSFGSSWSSGITGAMKSTIKKELKINNTEYALLEASEDFMVTALILVSGLVTDKIGGASAIVYGNIIYSIGSILVAAAAQIRSYNFMIGGRVILALGEIATQVAQYKVFSSWFPPNSGFASTVGLELAIRKIGGFVGQSSANPIAVVSLVPPPFSVNSPTSQALGSI
jgi:MFS family permease